MAGPVHRKRQLEANRIQKALYVNVYQPIIASYMDVGKDNSQ